MSTTIPIAVKRETPQVVGPFTVTAAQMQAASGGGYAGGVPLFTPDVGSLIFAAWSKVTEAWVVTDAGGGLNADPGDSATISGLTTGVLGHTVIASPILVSDGTSAVKAYPVSTFAASAGTTDVWFLVVPTG